MNKLEQQLDEALAKETTESLNKWMDEEMKKGSKLINIEPKLVGNECVHFPIPTDMKLEVKDGICYLYRDCSEHKENKCLQELKEYLSHATREELAKTMEEIEISLAPFKVGDKVIVKGYEKMGEDEVIDVFKTYDGDIKYKTKNHLNTHYFMEDRLTKVEKINKEENMEERKYADLRLDVDQDDKLATEVTINGDKITPPKNYLIGKITKVDNGMLVEFVKKQLQYPKDYKECCEIIGYRLCGTTIIGYKSNILKTLQELLIARDAYWKIAGEQMGLGEPWKPDWDNLSTPHEFIKIYKGCFIYSSRVLVFPTKEMRDAFYENFKYLIEQCKELL